MDEKKAPHKLQVEESKQDDNSIVEMTAAKMDELKIFKGDAVILKGMNFSNLITNQENL
jgi:transitional endoplasmic reticulum ATPase